MTAPACPVFRYFPRWPGMESDLRAAGIDGAQLPALIEMLERRDLELEQWLEHCVSDATTGPVGIKRTDLYDDFTDGTVSPPPVAETGQTWAAQNGGAFSTFYQNGLYNAKAAVNEGYLLADSQKADGRLRARIIPSSGKVSCGLAFRCAAAGFPGQEITFENSDGGGGGGPQIALRSGRYTPNLQTSSVVLTPGQVYDIDLTYKGTQITCLINGVTAISYNTATGNEARTYVGFRSSYTNYGAYGDGDDHMTYIWCTDAP